MATKKEQPKQSVVAGVAAKAAIVATQAAKMSDRNLEKRKEAAIAMNNAEFGLPSDPRARKMMMAITAFYGLDPIMGDVLIMGGSTLYITASGYMKKLEDKAVQLYGGKPWRWRKRPATKEEVTEQGYDSRKDPRVWYVELLPPEGEGDSAITSAFGECDAKNCSLQNISKEQGDPRVMNRMAIKRAQHECARDVAVFKLPSSDQFEKQMGFALDQMLSAGVQVVLDDGLQNAQGGYNVPTDQAAITAEPEGSRTEALAKRVQDSQQQDKPAPPAETTEQEETDNEQQAVKETDGQPPIEEPAPSYVNGGDADGSFNY